MARIIAVGHTLKKILLRTENTKEEECLFSSDSDFEIDDFDNMLEVDFYFFLICE